MVGTLEKKRIVKTKKILIKRFAAVDAAYVSFANECYKHSCGEYTELVWIHEEERKNISNKLKYGSCVCNGQEEFIVKF